MPAGRPPFYNNVEDIEAAIEGYWEYIKGETREEEIEVQRKIEPIKSPNQVTAGFVTEKQKITVVVRKPEHPTITGLALYLGFTSRQAIMNYQEKPEFVDAIKRAKLRIESAYEQAIHGTSPAGAIFALKNFGWTDKQEIEQSGGLTIKFEDPGSYVYPSSNQSDSGIPESI